MRPEWEELEHRRQRTEEGSLRLIIAVVAVAATVLLISHFSRTHESTPSVSTVEKNEAPIVRREPATSIQTAPEPVAEEYAAPASSSRQKHVAIYECVRNGQRVVSDQPCGDDARTRTLVVDQPRVTPMVRQRTQNPAAVVTQQSAQNTDVDTGFERCLYLRSKVTGDEKIHTCRSFETLLECAEAANRIDGWCGPGPR